MFPTNLTRAVLGFIWIDGSKHFTYTDLSYNELSGSFPSWVNDQKLQLNLVANNFTLSDSNSSSLPSGLYCLQRNFPCNRGSPIHSNFAIKCGGPALTSSDGIQYEADNQINGPATYYVMSSRKWAVSNVGFPADGPFPKYTFVSSSSFRNTLDPEIFQYARVSVGSLRYFGLGLENGNYTVNLQFAESEILDTVSWRSLGRRAFDIYIQGNLVEKDFDIKREAGGRSLTAVRRTYTAIVSKNYLEIHLFWAGKGTCCIPGPGSYGPLVSAISATPDFNPTVANASPGSGKKNRSGLVVGIVVPIIIISFLSAFAVYFLIWRRKRRQMFEEEEFSGMDARPYTFSYAELRAGTNDFNPANKLGEGGFGTVFKGTLYDGRVVAVKLLSVASHQGKSQFVAEIATISAVQHRNLVKLYGCCIEGDRRLLVYEYLENRSLDQALFRTKSLPLEWSTRFDVCLGVARGLAYLHEESRVRIVHRDVKASNILLDSDLNPKISDFGLAKLYDDKMTHVSTRVAGTIGYLAPEYAMRGHLTEKADVFGFGVVALEIVSGRPNSNTSLEDDKIYLLEWNERDLELVDPRLTEFNENEVKRVIGVALLCTQTSPSLRPAMSRVVAMLSGDIEVTGAVSKPGYLTNWKFTETTITVHYVQNQTNPTTDPFDARLVNSMFQRLGVRAPTQWNFSGELCSGLAVDSTDLQNLNPGIKCDCSYDNGNTCHITALRLYEMDLVGLLPHELWNLTYLDDLDLRRNYFTGPIPSSISRLTRMQFLSFGYNALSGEIPKELGMLTDLRSLAFDINNFTGPLPTEIGNLTRLTQFYFASSGISGVLPPSFAALQSLTTVYVSSRSFNFFPSNFDQINVTRCVFRVLFCFRWGSNTQLTGPIPDFIGNWSSLSVLRLQGNSFQGRIPLSFSNLRSLTDLRISDLSNATLSLEFIMNMTSIGILNLRDNNISGSIPSNIGELQNLQQLDLSSNSLSGSIPDSLFKINSLTHLFLGNNKLTGSLPQQKSSRLQNIDLSYNELSGRLPAWAEDKNLQLNLVANNFTSSDVGRSKLPSGLYCLQRNFPCYRGSPLYYNFSIRCGGPALRTADGILYEADNLASGPATYSVTNSRRWAMSNAGLPADGPNPRYMFSSPSRFNNTLDSELFQSARISAGSLRYFGLGLENGNYTVHLQFAEPEILDNVSWRSIGTRVFDIYAQGNLVEQNFDIKKAAGGRSFTAVQREFKVNVSENYLEIHLFWAGKGTCCVPAPGSYGPLVNAISATPDFIPTVSNIPPSSKRNRAGLIAGIVVPLVVASFLFVCCVYFFIWRKKRQQESEEQELFGMDTRPYTFSYAELRAATDDFNPSNKLGEGGFGSVFKGTLSDGRVVAVKQLSVASDHGKNQFVAEIATISAVQHRNLVKLHGCCIEGGKKLLVYEFLENKSLDQALFGTSSLHLDWPTRFYICLGVARGLAYLHEESRVRIVHRDVKASNILLDSDLNPKISDFGLAKLYDDKMTHISTHVAGTIGYLAPEYAMRGHLSEKADVFAFGIVTLEIVSGRPISSSSLEEDKIYLLELFGDAATFMTTTTRDFSRQDDSLSISDTTSANCSSRTVEQPMLGSVVGGA
ncbi:OLC1v1007550C1 [Oldenlandia corymbosa var. corymbosa]|uniref:non-specific serine/threonine protein kinase n=1 Tax=Oldenlandia corymbosa var. corymbosa TaxID=529605 RepID=A0AAV1DJI9_OLDCO|nr:OLC1v1007550C1 [Oldenlandia corymbosa var. corymbosa]